MFPIEIVLSTSAIIAALTIGIIHAMRFTKSSANRIILFLACAYAVLFFIYLAALPMFNIINPLIMARLFYYLYAISILFIVFFAIEYPKRNIASVIIIIVIVPAVALIPLSFLDDPSHTILKGSIQYNRFSLIYWSIQLFYLLLSTILLLSKSGIARFAAYKRDLQFLAVSLALLISMQLFTFALSPHYEIIQTNIINILSVNCIYILLILHSATGDPITLDLKKFFVESLYWCLTFLLLFIPSYLLIAYRHLLTIQSYYLPVIIALIIFIYLFTMFKYVNPRIEGIFQRGYKNLASKLDDIFYLEKEYTYTSDQEKLWEIFIKSLIDGIIDKFAIQSGYFFVLDSAKHDYVLTIFNGPHLSIDHIHEDDPIAAELIHSQKILYKPIIDFERQQDETHSSLLPFLDHNNCEIIMPFFNQDNVLIGFLLLGPRVTKAIYSKTLLSILDIYRIQFQHHLSNALMIENIKTLQFHEHDRIVVDSIKKKTIQESIEQIPGVRISSFHINNSSTGGDFFNSINLNNTCLALLTADTSYSGIDSGILSLQLFSSFHSAIRINPKADQILNALNWVICGSTYSKKYAPALCCIFEHPDTVTIANAAYNPLLVFNPKDGNFHSIVSTSPPLGVDKNKTYTSNTLKIERGTIGVIYSDGFNTAINESGESYSIDNIKNIILRDREKSPAVIIRNIYMNLTDFIKTTRQISDVTVIVFKITSGEMA